MTKKIDDDDLLWLGFDSNCGRLLAGSGTEERLRFGVPWGDTVGLISRPQVPFRGVRFLVHRPVASSFLIHSVRVGAQEVLTAHYPIPADAFITNLDKLASVEELFKRDKAYELKIDKSGAELLGMPLCLPTAQPGTDILIVIENIGTDKVPLRFVAGMLGVGYKHSCLSG
jgi:hypothetical protein